MTEQQETNMTKFYLRKVLEDLGLNVSAGLMISVDDMYDLISKEISVMHKQMRWYRGNIKNLLSSNEERRQFTIAAIEDFYR